MGRKFTVLLLSLVMVSLLIVSGCSSKGSGNTKADLSTPPPLPEEGGAEDSEQPPALPSGQEPDQQGAPPGLPLIG